MTDEPTTSETVLAAFPELRDTDYGRYLDMLDREAERGLAQFRADMARLAEKEGERAEQYLLEQAQFLIPTEEKARP